MNSKDITEKAKQILAQAESKLAEKNRKEIVEAIRSIKIQPNIIVGAPKLPDIRVPNVVVPPFPKIPEAKVTVNVPPIKIPEIKVPDVIVPPFPSIPEPKVTVNVPPIKIPNMKWPEGNMPIEGDVSLKGVNLENPLPVQLRDASGKPMTFPEYIGGGGGRGVTRITGGDVNVQQSSGAVDSVNVTQLGGNSIALNSGDADAGTLRTILAKSANATTAAVGVGADSSTNLVPTNLARKSLSIVHASTSNLYIATGTAASTTSLPIVANQVVVFDDYTGPVNAIAEEQAGAISVRYIEIV